MQTILNQMINEHEAVNINDQKNAIKEVIQEIVLCGLSRVGFFKEVAFYGGTALRIFYGLDRFSEDLDFSLFSPNNNFSFDPYIPGLINELNAYGLKLEIDVKEKTKDSDIKSAFIKSNTKELMLKFYPHHVNLNLIGKNELVKVKFEVDTTPPMHASIEYKFRQLPIPYEVAIYDMPSLFAGKIHAVLCRAWKNRIKGRDLYDFNFYIARKTPVNLKHLNARLIDSGYIKEDENLSLDELKEKLKEKFNSIDYKTASEDVVNFLKNPDKIAIWNSFYFNSLTNELTAKEQ
jgi:predicted nucleotidyltransferase component of viral defense system